MSENESGLKPCGYAVLCEAYEPEWKGSLIVRPPSVETASGTLENRVVILEIGPTAWADEPAPRASVGDKVYITKFAGVNAIGPADGKPYRLVNDRDIYCKITKEK